MYIVTKNFTVFEASYGILVFLMLSHDLRLNTHQKTKVGLQIFITGMAKALVPKDAFSLDADFVDRNRLEEQGPEGSGVDSRDASIDRQRSTSKGFEVVRNS